MHVLKQYWLLWTDCHRIQKTHKSGLRLCVYWTPNWQPLTDRDLQAAPAWHSTPKQKSQTKLWTVAEGGQTERGSMGVSYLNSTAYVHTACMPQRPSRHFMQLWRQLFDVTPTLPGREGRWQRPAPSIQDPVAVGTLKRHSVCSMEQNRLPISAQSEYSQIFPACITSAHNTQGQRQLSELQHILGTLVHGVLVKSWEEGGKKMPYLLYLPNMGVNFLLLFI